MLETGMHYYAHYIQVSNDTKRETSLSRPLAMPASPANPRLDLSHQFN